jgi:hypothetical protein
MSRSSSGLLTAPARVDDRGARDLVPEDRVVDKLRWTRVAHSVDESNDSGSLCRGDMQALCNISANAVRSSMVSEERDLLRQDTHPRISRRFFLLSLDQPIVGSFSWTSRRIARPDGGQIDDSRPEDWVCGRLTKPSMTLLELLSAAAGTGGISTHARQGRDSASRSDGNLGDC